MKESIDYRALLRSVMRHGETPGQGMIEEFSTVLRFVRALMTEQDGAPVRPEQRQRCALLLDAVGSWSKQPPDVMHANIERALAECRSLSNDARAMLLGAIVRWNLSCLPEATQVDDYYDLDRMIHNVTGNTRFELLGRLSLPVRDLPAEQRLRAWTGVSMVTLGIPRQEADTHSLGMARKAICG